MQCKCNVRCEQEDYILAWQNPKQIGDLEIMVITESEVKHEAENEITFGWLMERLALSLVCLLLLSCQQKISNHLPSPVGCR